MRPLSRCTISSQATTSPAMQRRTSMATTWASSNPHSPELLVCSPDVAQPGSLTPQYRYVFVVPKVRCFCKARHCSRGGKGEGEYKANNELDRSQHSKRGQEPGCSVHRGRGAAETVSFPDFLAVMNGGPGIPPSFGG